MVSPVAATRLQEELAEHSDRLAAAGCELLIARGQGSRVNLMAAVSAAARPGLPVWAVLERWSDAARDGDVFHALHAAGARVALFEVPSVALGLAELSRARESAAEAGLVCGVLLAASQGALPGFPDLSAAPEAWAAHALDLDLAGARVIGGGAGTTEEHLDALARALGAVHPSLPPRPSDSSPDPNPGL
jgi:5-methyltetrahydrofolate--homocysteine methyltransferase